MKRHLFLTTSVLFLILISCANNQDDVIGLYVSQNNVNTIDTVWILENGSYINLLHRKNDNSLIYKNTGKWKTSDGYITFEDYFSDEDEIHSKEFTAYEKVLMTKRLPLEKKSGIIIIHHKPMYDNIYLKKIK